MSLLLAIILGFIQAVTEFLPVSSSGHLVVFQLFLGPEFSTAKVPVVFDVLVHFATLIATVFYLRSELLAIILYFFSKSAKGRYARRLTFLLIAASCPAGFLGLGFKQDILGLFNSYLAAGTGFLFTAALLECAHRIQANKGNNGSLASDKGVDVPELSWKLPTFGQALFIGCAQAISLLPGVSRSGSTIAGALAKGLPVTSAIRFSFLLSLPAVGGACLLESSHLVSELLLAPGAFSMGFITALVFGYISLLILVKVVKGVKLRYFAIYTLLLGSGLHLFHLITY